MVDAAIAHSREPNSETAGRLIGQELADRLGGPPDAILVFASHTYDCATLLESLNRAAAPKAMVGGTTVGGFTAKEYLEGTCCAVGLTSQDIQFTASIGRNLSASRSSAAEQLVGAFEGVQSRADVYRSAIVLIDARADHADEFVLDLNIRTSGRYQFLGGGATDDMMVQGSHVFCGTQVHTDAAVALEVISKDPLGVGVCHSWEPAGPRMRVTESQGKRLISLNARPAADVLEQHASDTNQAFDQAQPLSFFLRNLVGIEQGKDLKPRVPLAILPDGSVLCAAEVPEGSTVRMLGTSAALAEQAAHAAVRTARAQLGGKQPSVGVFFDCIAARVRKEMGYGYDLRGVEGTLGTTRYAGFSTAGQIVRAEGEFGGFHNSTGVVLIFPE